MSDAPAAHPTFLLDAAGTVGLPAPMSDSPAGRRADEALWHALSHRVMRRPDALSEHVRRLGLCRRPGLAVRTAGALADLLHVLDGRGDALALRMLAGAAPRLQPREHELLASWIAGEVPPAASWQRLPGSVLPTLRSVIER